MKFSVLLPTRNRLEYLKYAVFSVLNQDYENWEIIISDNASEEDIEGFARSFQDPRIQYIRTDHFCPVTANWNNAIQKATGDYIIMLGDDDCLLNGYFALCADLIKQNDFPDMLYNGALTYVYPDVLPEEPKGYLVQCGHASFFVNKKEPFILDKEIRYRLVNEIMDFNVAVNFNMQHSLISRKLIHDLGDYGAFFQSPYPDYYATTALLLKAERVLAVPYSMVVIGVTPKSFGCYYLNNKEKEGTAFLQNLPSEDMIYKKMLKHILAGSDMNTCWLFAMELVRVNFSREFSLKVNYRKFRFLQVINQCKKFACHENVQFKDMISVAKNLYIWEKLAYFIPFLIALVIRLRPKDSKKRAWASKMVYVFSHPAHGIPRLDPGQYNNIMEVFQEIRIGS